MILRKFENFLAGPNLTGKPRVEPIWPAVILLLIFDFLLATLIIYFFWTTPEIPLY